MRARSLCRAVIIIYMGAALGCPASPSHRVGRTPETALALSPQVIVTQPETVRALAASQTNPTTSEGLAAMGAIPWHESGYRGQGVRIGIIDLGFTGYRGLLNLELPATVVVRNFVDGQQDTDVDTGTTHGTAVAEIIHDVAPDADLYLAKIRTHLELAEAVDWLLEQDVRVINTSLGWFTVSPGDGTGFFSDLVANAREQGALWVSAAGDERLRHWSGDWVDANNDGMLDFAPNNNLNWLVRNGEYELPQGTEIEVSLRWSDWEVVDQDYDLFLYRIEGATPRVAASSTNPQTGTAGDVPAESLIIFTPESGYVYGVAVKAVATTRPVHLDLFIHGDVRPHYGVQLQSLASPADVPDVISVTAVGPSAPHLAVSFSSQGPTKGPGGTASGGQSQPGLAAFAGVSTASEGTFGGTSAAAPHVTGAIALILSRYPDWSPEQVVDLLYATARDHAGIPGWDPIYGHGILYLGEAPVPPWHRLWLPTIEQRAGIP